LFFNGDEEFAALTIMMPVLRPYIAENAGLLATPGDPLLRRIRIQRRDL
jgi:hypothetical protein